MKIFLCVFMIVMLLSLWWSMKQVESFIDSTPETPSPLIHICLTTIPERLTSEHFQNVISSLLKQTYSFHRIILNIPYVFEKTGERYPQVPSWLENHSKIYVNRCEDAGPSTKLLGSFEEIPMEDIIMIVDDDIIYREECLAKLMEEWNKHPTSVISHCVSKRDNFLEVMGFGGYLFQKKLLKGIERYYHPKVCYKVDDTWISVYLYNHNIPVVKTKGEVWDISAYRDKTDEHPKWDELCNDKKKNKIIQQCIQAVIS